MIAIVVLLAKPWGCCIALALLLYFMYISPPNTTRWCQG